MTCTEGREPSGLAMESLSRVLGDVRRSSILTMTFSLKALFVIVTLLALVVAAFYWASEPSEVSTDELHWHDYSVGIVNLGFSDPPAALRFRHHDQTSAQGVYITLRRGGYTPGATGGWHYQVGLQLPVDVSAGARFTLSPASSKRHLESIGEYDELGFLQPGEFVASSFGSPMGGCMLCDDPNSDGQVSIISMTREEVTFKVKLHAEIRDAFNVDIDETFTLPRE